MERTKAPKTKETKVFVALSGGVDSAVSAALLKGRGYDVTGVFIKIWQPTMFDRECSSRAERHDAMRVCAALRIPFRTLDLSDTYRREVVSYMIEEYRNGRTPNPDVMCNTRIKFGAFLQWSLQEGADMIATGHYARLRREALNPKSEALNNIQTQNPKPQTTRLLKGIDENKDQSYFLWTLTQEQLARTLFPIGTYEKARVRALARQYNLPVAEKKDSQGLCFIGPVDVRSFLKTHIPERPGVVLNERKEPIGTHDGVSYYTLGQRHGFSLNTVASNTKPHYVVEKDVARNTLVISENPAAYAPQKSVVLANINYRADPRRYGTLSARFRYRQPLRECVLVDAESNRISFAEPQHFVAPGQSLVLYAGEECIGGGVISV